MRTAPLLRGRNPAVAFGSESLGGGSGIDSLWRDAAAGMNFKPVLTLDDRDIGRKETVGAGL